VALCYDPKSHRHARLRDYDGAGQNNYDAGVAEGAVKFWPPARQTVLARPRFFSIRTNILRMGAPARGASAGPDCGEIGKTAPGGPTFPPAPVNLAIPKNEPDGMDADPS